MANTIHVDVVSAEESIFSGTAEFVALPGESGELGILPQHTPLLTRIKPGAVRIKVPGQQPYDGVFASAAEAQTSAQALFPDAPPACVLWLSRMGG